MSVVLDRFGVHRREEVLQGLVADEVLAEALVDDLHGGPSRGGTRDVDLAGEALVGLARTFSTSAVGTSIVRRTLFLPISSTDVCMAVSKRI